MSVEVRDKGHYELFETTKKHQILVLNDKRYFAWVKGQQGEILVHSDSDHKKDKTLQDGDFYEVDFKDEEDYQDMPHLLLENGDAYDEHMLPNGLPTEKDHQKKVVNTDKTLSKDKLKKTLKRE
jgi:hypothetical protein